MRDLERVDAFFGGFFGVEASALRAGGVRVVPHARLGDWNGVWIFRRGETVLISVPPERAGVISRRARGLVPERAHETATLAALVRERASRVIGPSFWGCVDAAGFRPFRPETSGPATAADRPQLEAFARDVDPRDWHASGIDLDDPRLCVSRAADRIAALAGWRVLGAEAGDPGVVTHPAHRGKGHGSAVVSAVVGRALARGELGLFQTLVSNTRALAIARRLGFEPYAENLALRLT